MNFIPSQIEKYSRGLKAEFNVQIDLEDDELYFRFVNGRFADSSLAIYLAGKEIIEILKTNGVLGEAGKIKEVLKTKQGDMDHKIQDLIYETLAKYVIQMLHAATGSIFYPEIIPLKKHERDYFRKPD